MKTSELRSMVVHAYQERPSSSTAYPALVLETALWTEKNEWFTNDEGERKERRILCRAEKGARAGTGNSAWSRRYHKTGIPVLKLNMWDSRFMASANPEDRITENPHELLTRALSKLNIMELVDSGQSVFQESEERVTRKTHTIVMAQHADGETREVSVELELVRPQSLTKQWHEHLEAAEKAAVARANMEKKTAEAKAAKDATAWSIRDRVTALLGDGDAQRYNVRDERYDVHREWTSSGITSKYEISESVLLKLLELAEKGINQ